MTFDSPHLYRRLGKLAQVPKNVIANALRQASRVRGRRVSVILSLNHLAYRTGADYSYLRSIVERKRDPYLQFSRMRRDGRKTRIISAPEPILMSVQRWILQNIFSNIDPGYSCFAYTRGRSVASCAQRHAGARFLLKFDLHNFFGSINESQVFVLFRDLGYAPLVSLELSRICTRLSASMAQRSVAHSLVNKYPQIPKYRVGKLGVLPQGGPTSGAIANLVTRQLDIDLEAVAAAHQLTYTRYADDITLSGDANFSRSLCSDIVNQVRAAVANNGFSLHEKKVRVVPPGARLIVLGVVLTESGITLSREVKARIEKHLFGADRFHLQNHADHCDFSSVIGFVNHVRGLLDFAHDVDPEYATPLFERWNRILTRDANSLFAPDRIR